MAYEVELKARLRRPEETEAKIIELGGIFEGEVYKEDVYFRRMGNRQPLPDERYRLRRENDAAGQRAIVTFKQLTQINMLEVNEEIEFTVDDAQAFFRFANHFGFEPFVIKRKKGRNYRLGRVRIEINTVDYLGHFAEIEVMTTSKTDISLAQLEITQMMGHLGLTEANLEPRRYIDLIQQAHPVQYRFINDTALEWPFEEV